MVLRYHSGALKVQKSGLFKELLDVGLVPVGEVVQSVGSWSVLLWDKKKTKMGINEGNKIRQEGEVLE